MWHSEEEIREAIESGETWQVAGLLDGTDYDRGELESLKATVEALTLFAARLVITLHGKGLIDTPGAVVLFVSAGDVR